MVEYYLGLNVVLKENQIQNNLKTRVTDSALTDPCFSGWIRRRDLSNTGELYQHALVHLFNYASSCIYIFIFTVTHVRSLYPDKEYTGFQPASPVFRNKRKWK